MSFMLMSEYVDARLKNMALDQKILLFKELLKYPINVKCDKFTYLNEEWEEFRMKDFMNIAQNWLSVSEYEILYKHFNSNEF